MIWAIDGEPADVGQRTRVVLDEGEHTVTLSVVAEGKLHGQMSVTIAVASDVGPDPTWLFLPVIQR